MPMDDDKIIWFHVCTDDGHVPMKVIPGSAGYDFWPSGDVTLTANTINRVATGVKVIIPASIIAVTGVIDEDYRGEIRLLMHNMTEANYKVLKENPVAQMVVY